MQVEQVLASIDFQFDQIEANDDLVVKVTDDDGNIESLKVDATDASILLLELVRIVPEETGTE